MIFIKLGNSRDDGGKASLYYGVCESGGFFVLYRRRVCSGEGLLFRRWGRLHNGSCSNTILFEKILFARDDRSSLSLHLPSPQTASGRLNFVVFPTSPAAPRSPPVWGRTSRRHRDGSACGIRIRVVFDACQSPFMDLFLFLTVLAVLVAAFRLYRLVRVRFCLVFYRACPPHVFATSPCGIAFDVWPDRARINVHVRPE